VGGARLECPGFRIAAYPPDQILFIFIFRTNDHQGHIVALQTAVTKDRDLIENAP
jgi:hypothetical protein